MSTPILKMMATGRCISMHLLISGMHHISIFQASTWFEQNSKITDKNIYASVWKWQNFSFEENILKTMHDLIPQFEKIKINTNSDKFSFNFFGKK